jgi:hypothetical protein
LKKKKTNTKKGWCSGMAQGIGPEFNPSMAKKKKMAMA